MLVNSVKHSFSPIAKHCGGLVEVGLAGATSMHHHGDKSGGEREEKM